MVWFVRSMVGLAVALTCRHANVVMATSILIHCSNQLRTIRLVVVAVVVAIVVVVVVVVVDMVVAMIRYYRCCCRC